ncbi:alternate-type signal peptide domain-containing protein [Rhodococcus sp. 24CO]|uniref:alternate-type signal peptide domain-containing protein n=1 Tax=Rhodococcus sp. 24CO TaxID=3117460 RepID=UPI003D356725
MQRQIKGALAATVALVVMVGGGNSLAKWVDQETLSGATVTAGTLSLGPCVKDGVSGWSERVFVPAPDPNPNEYVEIANIATYRLRAGYDYVYYCYSPVSATGPRLRASVTADPSLAGGTLPSTVNAFRTYVSTQANVELYNSTLTPKIRSDLTSAQNGQDVLVTVAFTILPNDPLSAGGTLNMAGLSLVTQQLAPT